MWSCCCELGLKDLNFIYFCAFTADVVWLRLTDDVCFLSLSFSGTLKQGKHVFPFKFLLSGTVLNEEPHWCDVIGASPSARTSLTILLWEPLLSGDVGSVTMLPGQLNQLSVPLWCSVVYKRGRIKKLRSLISGAWHWLESVCDWPAQPIPDLDPITCHLDAW